MTIKIANMTVDGSTKMMVPTGHTMTATCNACGHQDKIAGPATVQVGKCPSCGEPNVRIDMGLEK